MTLSPWLLCQLAALSAAAWLFFVTTRGLPAAHKGALRWALVRALPFTVVGALSVDYALRVVGYALSGARGPLPAFGGIMAYGALLGLGGAYAFFVRGARLGVYPALDRVTGPLALLVAVGRVGCFLAGCEHGAATSAPWGVRYPASHPHFGELVRAGLAEPGAAWSGPLHPATLYEAAFALAACGLAVALLRRPSTKPGGVFFAGTLVYAGGRFVSEAFRGDGAGGLSGGDHGALTTGQAMSLFAIGLAVSLALRANEAQPVAGVEPTKR
jgi:prolipoprotein diacylglyceryltransferase